MSTAFRLIRFVTFFLAALVSVQMPAHAQGASPETVWRLLDYMAVDYGGAVSGGRVTNQAEYAEMLEFAAQVRDRLARLPSHPARAGLIAQADELAAAVRARAEPRAVSVSARRLAAALLAAYPVALAPQAPPDLARGAQLYRENCASCHGTRGDGRGPAAQRLDPPPVDFTDRTRARERSVFALYQVIDQGLEGTAMQSFSHLPAQDRWALAFHVSRFAYPDTASGERLWRDHANLRRHVPDMNRLAGITPAELANAVGAEQASAILAYLRAHPEAVAQEPAHGVSLALARNRLADSLRAYQAGNRESATDQALAAYLDGFEPVEPLLRIRDASLMARIETAMIALRASIGRGAPAADVASQIAEVNRLFDQAEAALAPDRASAASSFVGAFTILLREGLEALLIVIAMIAFLKRAERPEVLVYVHGGWIAALALGGFTWALATYVIGISGASRELTEGFGSLFAAAVLLSVGVWMHGKSQADAWQRYIREKLGAALSRGSAWFLFGLTFLVVYREVFETILFYATLWAQGNEVAVLGGALAASALLAVIAGLMLRYSRKLPIAKFFAYSSALVAVLAVVLAGKGVAGLQEAGLVDVTPIASVPRVDMLGLFPTVQTVVAQLCALAVVLLGFGLNRRRAHAAELQPE